MALQELSGRPSPGSIEDGEKVTRAEQALADVRGLLRNVNGRVAKVFGDAMRSGIDTHRLCDDAFVCREIRNLDG